MNIIKENLRIIVVMLILTAGLATGIYLVNHPQIFKSRADQAKETVTLNRSQQEITVRSLNLHINLGEDFTNP